MGDYEAVIETNSMLSEMKSHGVELAAILLAVLLALSWAAIVFGFIPNRTTPIVARTSIAANCNLPVSSDPYSFVLKVGHSSPAYVCANLYYYNLTSPLRLNPATYVQVPGIHPSADGTLVSFDGTSNFTITSQPTSILIGGPNNTNEGVQVVFNITMKTGASGTYGINFGALAPEAVTCGMGDFTLIAGSGSPHYESPSTCYAYPRTGNQAFPYGMGIVFVQVTGATNSTM